MKDAFNNDSVPSVYKNVARSDLMYRPERTFRLITRTYTVSFFGLWPREKTETIKDKNSLIRTKKYAKEFRKYERELFDAQWDWDQKYANAKCTESSIDRHTCEGCPEHTGGRPRRDYDEWPAPKNNASLLAVNIITPKDIKEIVIAAKKNDLLNLPETSSLDTGYGSDEYNRLQPEPQVVPTEASCALM